jgi:hypothetical protein
MQLPASSNLFDTGRFWSTLSDNGVSNSLNFEHKFGDPEQKRTATFKAGYLLEYRKRSFDARYISYLYPGNFDAAEGVRLSRLPIDQIFASGNVKRNNGFVIEEGTNPSDSYNGSNLLTAGYVGGSLPFGKFDLAGGFRLENNIQKVDAITNNGPLKVENTVLAPLPFLNLALGLNSESLRHSCSINLKWTPMWLVRQH